MEISEYLHVLRRRWRTVTVVTFLAVLLAGTLTVLTAPTYTATTQAFVSTPSSGSTADLLQGNNFSQQRVRSYTDIVVTPVVLDPVIRELDLRTTARSLASRVFASSPPDTVLIDISVEDGTPSEAARTANAIAKSFAARIAELEAPADGSDSPVRISIVRPAETPEAPTSPQPLRNVALALAVGLLAGLALALLRQRLDTAVTGEEDVLGLTEAAVLGAIAFDPRAKSMPLALHDTHSPRAEAFRRLRTNLQFVDVANEPRSIVITSAVAGEGKSTTAVNLGTTLALAGRRVCLVEGDLRQPKTAEYLGLEPAVGLTTVLIGRAELDDVLQPWGDIGLDVLPAGEIPPNPSEILGSEAMAGILRRLEAAYDIVIIDAPPVLPVTDAAILSRLADGAILVTGCGRVERGAVAKAVSSLNTVNARILGLVLNMVRQDRESPESYGYGYVTSNRLPWQRQADGSRRVRRASPAVAGRDGREVADVSA